MLINVISSSEADSEQVYWVLDVKNDTNQAMQTRDYWPKPMSSDPEVGDSDSIQAEEDSPDLVENTLDEESHLQGRIEAPAVLSGNGSPVHTFSSGLTPSARHHAVETNNNQSEAKIAKSYEDPHPREQSLQDFRDFFFGARGSLDNGNWTDLFATSVNWMLLDFTFYFLGVNSSRLVPNMFSEPSMEGPFYLLSNNEWHTLVATSIGAVLGGAIALKIMHNFSRKSIQMWGFLVLAILFVVVGILYVRLLGTNIAPVIVVVYVLCQLFFNIGESWSSLTPATSDVLNSLRFKHHNLHSKSTKQREFGLLDRPKLMKCRYLPKPFQPGTAARAMVYLPPAEN